MFYRSEKPELVAKKIVYPFNRVKILSIYVIVAKFYFTLWYHIQVLNIGEYRDDLIIWGFLLVHHTDQLNSIVCIYTDF